MTTKGIYLLLICVLIAPQCFLPVNAQSQEKQIISHQLWGELLQKHVDEQGDVNYMSFKEDLATLDKYLSYLAPFEPGENWSQSQNLAFYINLYNAATVKLILQHYPINSIRDINQPWTKKWIRLGDEELSLNQIEHKILRKMNEPRIHFAINCASASCPKLLNVPFESEKIEEQLEKVSRDFVNDPFRNKITQDEVALSALFKWYKKDFTEGSDLLDYIMQYSDQPISAKAKVSYLKYDWSLNEQ